MQRPKDPGSISEGNAFESRCGDPGRFENVAFTQTINNEKGEVNKNLGMMSKVFSW